MCVLSKHETEMRLSAETREFLAQCCTEFVQLLSSESNEVCEKEQKKTITAEHVLRALRELGFDSKLTLTLFGTLRCVPAYGC